MLIQGLKLYYPNLRIVGEESRDYDGEIEFNYRAIEE